jgi:mono/diheme cytochrome c family protein
LIAQLFRLHRFAAIVGAAAVCGLVLVTYLFWPEKVVPAPSLGTLNASVDRGHYLATIGDCVSCHTANGGEKFAGGRLFRTPFGDLYSANITSDNDTGIGRWSFADFYQAIKHGVRPDGTHLYPAFPYTSFAKLTDSDIGSLYLYTRTIRPVKAAAIPNKLNFPYNMRFTLQAWNRLFHSPATYVGDPNQSPEWNRGAYLVQGLGHCGGCHTPRNSLGAENHALALTGGVLFDEVRPDKFRQWSAVNLTPADSGLASWTIRDIVDYLKRGQNKLAVVHGPMNEVVMNSTRYLTDEDAVAIALYLKGRPAKDGQSVTQRPTRQQLAAGEVEYTVHCGTCHLPTGAGDKILGVTLVENPIVQAAEPMSLINVILYGPHMPPPPFVANRSRMKAFGKRLSDADIADLSTYVRTSFGNHAGVVSAAAVGLQR